jgi:hypothetical protein
VAEITEPSEAPAGDPTKTLGRVRQDIRRTGEIANDCRIVDEHLILVDPAYVVFAPGTEEIVRAAQDFLRDRSLTPLGRFGNWEYSSMTQVMRDGFSWAEKASNGC